MSVVAALLLTLSSPALAQDAISYRVTFPAATNHYLDVEATLPAGDESVEVMMAVWTPGSYLVREHRPSRKDAKRESAPKALHFAPSQLCAFALSFFLVGYRHHPTSINVSSDENPVRELDVLTAMNIASSEASGIVSRSPTVA